MGQDTASRILDAAESLLLAYGYRKVTIDEVAGRAGVGKGTAYLYWSSKRELFAAVLVRDTADRVAEQLAALTADPAEVQLHRAMRRTFLQTMRRPLAKALATGDYAMLGEVLTMSETGARLTAGSLETMTRHLAVLHRHGLLAGDPGADATVLYQLSAAVLGSYLLEGGIPSVEGVPGVELSLEDKADALAAMLRRALVPPAGPSPDAERAAAAELTDIYRRWLADLTGSLPEAAVPELPE